MALGLVAGDAAQLSVAGVALGDIHLRFAWHAWHLAASTCVLRGRRSTWSHPFSFCVAGVAGVAGVALGDIHLRLCVAGVALGHIHLRFAWQVWHLWHRAGSWFAIHHLSHTPSFTHYLCHTQLSRTIFVTHNLSYIIVVRHHLSHTTWSHTHTHHLSHTIFHGTRTRIMYIVLL